MKNIVLIKIFSDNESVLSNSSTIPTLRPTPTPPEEKAPVKRLSLNTNNSHSILDNDSESDDGAEEAFCSV